MEDTYSHLQYNVIYVAENIPGTLSSTDSESISIGENFESQLTQHCKCEDTCDERCQCILQSGGLNYMVDVSKRKYLLNMKTTSYGLTSPIFECNSLCSCRSNCSNRLVQLGPLEGLIVKKCDDNFGCKGFGLFTECFIPKGTFVCEYAGEVITAHQALIRHKQNFLLNMMNYIICVNEHCNGQVTKTIVDPSKFGNIGRYVNHSCEPNCEIVLVRVDNPIPRLAIFCIRDIDPNNEITFDYGSHVEDSRNMEYKEDCSRKECFCGSQCCRKWLPFVNY